MEKFIYTGCFFNYDLLQEDLKHIDRTPLTRSICNPHITFSYDCSEIPGVPVEFFGDEIMVKAIAYGCDGENEALKVKFLTMPKGLKLYANKISVPHITISVSATGEPVNSAKLKFKRIKPFFLIGVFGGMDDCGKIHYSMF